MSTTVHHGQVINYREVGNREGAKKYRWEKAGLLPAQVTTGKRRPDRPLVLGRCTHRPEISGISLVSYLSGHTQRHQW